MDFLYQFGDLVLKDTDLFSCSLIECQKASQFRVKDGIVYANGIGGK